MYLHIISRTKRRGRYLDLTDKKKEKKNSPDSKFVYCFLKDNFLMQIKQTRPPQTHLHPHTHLPRSNPNTSMYTNWRSPKWLNPTPLYDKITGLSIGNFFLRSSSWCRIQRERERVLWWRQGAHYLCDCVCLFVCLCVCVILYRPASSQPVGRRASRSGGRDHL